jgi:hypothetical protein
MVHFPLHSSLISVFSNRFQWLVKRCRVQMNQALWANATVIAASPFGQSVNGWTCSSPEPRIFVCRTGRRIDHREHCRTSTETYRQHELLCSSFAAGPKLGIRCKKEVSAIWEPRSSRIAMFRGSRRAYCRNDNLMLWQAKDCIGSISDWWLQPLDTSRKGEFGWVSSQEASRADALRQM